MRLAFTIATATIIGITGAHAVIRTAETWTPTMAQVQHVESIVHMPGEAQAITAYQRFYAGVVDKGRKIIEGIYLAHGVTKDMQIDHSRDVQIVAANDIPFIMDGGCLMVTVYYDVASDKITTARCNGYA